MKLNKEEAFSLNFCGDKHLHRLKLGEFLLQEALITLSKTSEHYLQEELPKYDLNGSTYTQPSTKIFGENFKFIIPNSLYPLIQKFTEDVEAKKMKILQNIEQVMYQVYNYNLDSEDFIKFIKEKLGAFSDSKDVDNILYRLCFYKEPAEPEVSKTFSFTLPDERILYIDVIINYEELVLPWMKENGFYGWYMSNTKKKDCIHTDSRKRNIFFWRITNLSSKEIILLWFSNINALEE